MWSLLGKQAQVLQYLVPQPPPGPFLKVLLETWDICLGWVGWAGQWG